ncbi:hypothetical protein BD408DRAFT_412289 [Parasitella parasitica]|nr:hypothetical protein BD408DRAFT_412289 [Parasitella parasitica]
MNEPSVRYKRLIKSKSNVEENATRVLERLAVRSYIANLPDESFFGTLDMLGPRSYSAKLFWDVFCPDTEQMLQLWDPIFCSNLHDLPFKIGKSKFLSALRNFYLRSINVSFNDQMLVDGCVDPDVESHGMMVLGCRVWENDKTIWKSQLYANEIKEHRRNNTFIMFKATHRTK